MTKEPVAANWGDMSKIEGEWDADPLDLWDQGKISYRDLSAEDQEIMNRTLSLTPEDIAALKGA